MRMEDMQEKKLETKNGNVYYWIHKHEKTDAKTICFLPGLTATHDLFVKQIPAFGDDYNLITWDAPAHGKSKPYNDFSFDNMALNLKDILKKEDISQVIVVGQSAGGFLGQVFADRYPDMVSKLFTIGAPPLGNVYYSKSDFFWLRQIEWMAKLYPDKFLRRSMAKMCGKTKSAYDNMYRMLSCYSKRELCHLMYLGFVKIIDINHEPRIQCPVCLTIGEYDRTGKIQHLTKTMHRLNGYPLHVIPNAAHNANDDNSEEVNRILSGFIRE